MARPQRTSPPSSAPASRGPGAVLATVGIFLPALVFVAPSGPLVPRLRGRPRTAPLPDGVNAPALGLMEAVTRGLVRAAVVDWLTALLPLAAAVLLRWRVSTTWLVLGGAAPGGALSAANGASTEAYELAAASKVMVSGARSWLPWARGGQARTVRGVPGGSVSGVRPSCWARPGPGRSSTHSVPGGVSPGGGRGPLRGGRGASAGASVPVSWRMGMASSWAPSPSPAPAGEGLQGALQHDVHVGVGEAHQLHHPADGDPLGGVVGGGVGVVRRRGETPPTARASPAAAARRYGRRGAGC